MSVGAPVFKQDLDKRAGDLALAFQRLAGDVATLKGYLDGMTDESLIAQFGYTPNEVAILKTAITDLAQLVVNIGYGHEALGTPKDFTVFLRQLWGVGAY